eukprot:NODE_7565_length_1567_cov_18.852778.p1 GENE.NODE_7565_length_1567_cov_18.852778~~NODE_7565_length_1567_cov_18.852778.p1  ORF type:complete len:420 (-),score=139.80 NODE_7565_length_1567_cov_18.852778:218-1477(-)
MAARCYNVIGLLVLLLEGVRADETCAAHLAEAEVMKAQLSDYRMQVDRANAEAAKLRTELLAESQKTVELTAQMAVLNSELDVAQHPDVCNAHMELSFTSAVKKAGKVGSNLAQKVRTHKTVEHVAKTVGEKVSVAAVAAKGAVESMRSVDYHRHVAPVVEKFTTATKDLPGMEHVGFAYERTTSVINSVDWESHTTAVKDKAEFAKEQIKTRGADVLGTVSTKFDNHILDPIFTTAASAAPEHGHFLPKSSIDRMFFIAMVFIIIYFVFRGVLATLGISFKVVRGTTRRTFATWRALIKAWIYCLTFGYFFGFCARRKKKEGVTKAGKQPKDTGAANGKEKHGKAKPAATIDDVTAFLNKAKKDGKLDQQAKLAAQHVHSKQAFEASVHNLGNKTLAKDTLVKAAAKFKDLDIKRIGL